MLLSVLLVFSGWGLSAAPYLAPDQFEQSDSKTKALIFLSATCPCSQSHVEHLNQLAKEFKEFEVFGVITEDPSHQGLINSYYSQQRFKFPILEDPGQGLVKKYQALKTPHVVLLHRGQSGSYQILYQGGVSDERDFARSRKFFLRENLVALNKGLPPPYQHGRSLGCYIRRF